MSKCARYRKRAGIIPYFLVTMVTPARFKHGL
jgi:hypothetical protein